MPSTLLRLAPLTCAVALALSGSEFRDVDARPSPTVTRHAPRAHGIVTSFETGARLRLTSITFYGWSFRTTVKTDSSGAYSVENLPVDQEVFFKLRCPIVERSDTVAGPFLMSHAGLDTTLNLRVQFRGCTHLDRRHPLIAGRRRNPTRVDSSRIDPDVASVYRGILDAFYPPSRPARGPILLRPSDVRLCAYCLEPAAPRLIRQGLLDPSVEANFAAARIDTLPRLFSYRQVVDTMPTWDRYWLAESGYVDWDAMQDAYPGVAYTFSFLRVGFSNDRRQALAEFYVDSAGERHEPELMLLKRSGSEWRVSLRHLEQDATSGEFVRGKCEPTDAPAHLPSRAQLQQLVGDYKIIRVGATKAIRGRTDTLRVRLGRLAPDEKKTDHLTAKASVIHDDGRPDEKTAVEFETDRDTATITLTERLPEGRVMLDGWIEWHQILRIEGDSFFGAFFTENGPTIPLKGYFCAQK